MTIPSLFANHGGFGLNLDLFETNIINLAIEKALAVLPGKLTDEAQAQLLNQSINNLGNA